MILQKEELLQVSGGGISGTLINAFVRGINTILELGRSLGSALRRVKEQNICQL